MSSISAQVNLLPLIFLESQESEVDNNRRKHHVEPWKSMSEGQLWPKEAAKKGQAGRKWQKRVLRFLRHLPTT